MRGRFLVSTAMLALVAWPAAAQEVAGKWAGSADTEFGPFELVFEFAVEGAVLTGAMINDFIGAIPIMDGMVEGDEIAFTLNIDGGGGAMVINYKGMVEGNELKLMGTFEGGAPPGGGPNEQTLTLTRAE